MKDMPALGFSAFMEAAVWRTSEEAVLPKYLRQRHMETEVPVVSDWTTEIADCAMCVLFGPFVDIQRISVLIAKNLSSSIRRIMYDSTSAPGYSYLELNTRDATKGHALKHVCKTKGVKRTRVAAIGDYHNDLEMLQYAGVPAAVSNAIVEVKSVAEIVTERSNDEGGVGEFLELLIDARNDAE